MRWLLILILLLGLNVRAQEDFFKHSVGGGLVGYQIESPFPFFHYHYFLNEKLALRSGVIYSPTGPYKHEGLLNIGIQRHLSMFKDKLRFFYGADLGFMYREWRNSGYYEIQSNLGIGPVLGLEYLINNRISISTEIACIVGRYQYRTNLEHPWKQDKVEWWDYWNLHRNLGIAVNFYF